MPTPPPDFSGLTTSFSMGPIISAVLSIGMVGLSLILLFLGVVMVLDGLGYDPLDRSGDRKRDRRYRARYERESDRERYAEWKKEHGY
jgi:hypothetical protein